MKSKEWKCIANQVQKSNSNKVSTETEVNGHKASLEGQARASFWDWKEVFWLKLPRSDAAPQEHTSTGVKKSVINSESMKRMGVIILTREGTEKLRGSWVASHYVLASRVQLGW